MRLKEKLNDTDAYVDYIIDHMPNWEFPWTDVEFENNRGFLNNWELNFNFWKTYVLCYVDLKAYGETFTAFAHDIEVYHEDGGLIELDDDQREKLLIAFEASVI